MTPTPTPTPASDSPRFRHSANGNGNGNAPSVAAAGDAATSIGPQLTAEQVWQAVAKASFAVLSHLTPAGEPRSTGVVYTTVGPRMYVVTATDSWKARHIAADGRVSVTVPVRRGGILTLLVPIPPATISFPAAATVRAAEDPQNDAVMDQLRRMLPPASRPTCSVIEIVPRRCFVTYGIGVPLMQMRDPARSRARVAIDT